MTADFRYGCKILKIRSLYIESYIWYMTENTLSYLKKSDRFGFVN